MLRQLQQNDREPTGVELLVGGCQLYGLVMTVIFVFLLFAAFVLPDGAIRRAGNWVECNVFHQDFAYCKK